MLKGRSKEQKRELVKELTSTLNKACGSNYVGIDVILTKIEKENWSIGGTLFQIKNKNKIN